MASSCSRNHQLTIRCGSDFMIPSPTPVHAGILVFVFCLFVFVCLLLVSCMHSQLKCGTILQGPENNVSLLPFITSGSLSLSSLPQWSQCLEGMSYYTDVSFQAKHFSVSYSLHRGLCISHHLMPKEASLTRVEKCPNLWV